MTNASSLNAEATPYNKARNSQENETDNRTGNLEEQSGGTICCSHPSDEEFRLVHFRHLLVLILEWKC